MAVEQTCFACTATEQQCEAALAEKERECEQARWAVHVMESELEQARQDAEIAWADYKKVRRQLATLMRKDDESLGRSKGHEKDEITEYLQAWLTMCERRFAHVPVQRQALFNPGGTAHKLVRAARGSFTHKDMMCHIRGVELSPWHMEDFKRVSLKALLGESPQSPNRDLKMQAHIARFDRFLRLVEAGFSDTLARESCLIEPATAQKTNDFCRGCGAVEGRDCTCGSITR